MVKDTLRFQRFGDKVIYLTATYEQMMSTLPRAWRWTERTWELENAMRSHMIKLFREMDAGEPMFSLQQRIMNSVGGDKSFQELMQRPNRYKEHDMSLDFKLDRYKKAGTLLSSQAPLALQNDGDEFCTGPALYHLKHCELRNRHFPILVPAYSYRRNIVSIHGNGEKDLQVTAPDDSFLTDFVYSAGPKVHLLFEFLLFNSTMRSESPVTHDVHLGLGAAMHMSSVLEPGEMWYKSVVSALVVTRAHRCQ